jgi:hypothetical protein
MRGAGKECFPYDRKLRARTAYDDKINVKAAFRQNSGGIAQRGNVLTEIAQPYGYLVGSCVENL